MTAYTFDKVTDQAKDLPSGTVSVLGQFELTGALADDDTIGGITIPAGAFITAVTLDTDELDTNASPVLTLNVGDATDEDRFVDGAVTGAAFNTQGINVNAVSGGDVTAGMGYEYTSNTDVIITCDGVPATAATSGLVMLKVEYTLDAF